MKCHNIIWIIALLLLCGCSFDKQQDNVEVCETDLQMAYADSLLEENAYELAIEQYKECLEHYNKEDDKEKMSDCYFQMATAYERIGELDKGFEMIRQSIHIDSLLNNIGNLSSSYNTLAAFALASKDTSSAKKYINHAISLESMTENQENMSSRYGLAAEIYAQSDSAVIGLDYATKAFLLDSLKHDTASMGKRLCQMGDTYKSMQRFRDAEKAYLRAEKYLSQSNLVSSTCITYKQIGNLYEVMDNNEKAIDYYEKSVSLARKFNMNYLLVSDLDKLSKLYQHSDNQKGYQYALEALTLKDSIFNEETRKSTQEFSAHYDLLEKERKIELQESQIRNQRTWVGLLLTFILLLFAVIGFLLFYLNLKKEKYKLHRKYVKALTEDFNEDEEKADSDADKDKEEEKTEVQKQIVKNELTQTTAAERQFLRQVNTFVEEHMEDSTLSSVKLSEMLCLGQRQFNRKMKAITGDDTGSFIKVKRITRAKQLLATSELSIGEIQTRCGFETPSYFSKVFKDLEGITPSEYRKEKQFL